MLWQGIHFLNVFSPAAISPATAAPAEDASVTIAIETIFMMLRDPYSALPVTLSFDSAPGADNAEARREGATNHIAGGGSSNNFNGLQRRDTRFPANFIADRAEEDDGGEAFQHSSGC